MPALYHNFEKVFFDEAPSIPQTNRVEFLPVNKRVKMYNFRHDDASGFDWSKVELTAAEPIAAK